MKKGSPWAGGWRPHKAIEEKPDQIDKIVHEVWQFAISLFIQRVGHLSLAEQGAIAMLIADKLTATFIAGLTRDDPDEAASFMAMHMINVTRRIREEHDDE